MDGFIMLKGVKDTQTAEPEEDSDSVVREVKANYCYTGRACRCEEVEVYSRHC